ncbi:4-hydroxy-2-oxovalerate aldolase [Actinomadura sp. B10D3]|uniref:4-hydroxy-2-oxovalerate aldolase n=1 Tax=Actinomadura sp. B10D3 TaxID=3153557 RepID=UPI00325F0CF7
MTGYVTYLDTTLRDGSHALDHELSTELVHTVTGDLARAGVRYVEVGHGAGLGGSSLLMGKSSASDIELLDAAAAAGDDVVLTALLVPGFGTLEELQLAVEHGVRAVRVATHATEADAGLQHLTAARDYGLLAIGFLMMAHSADPESIAAQAAMMEDAGAQVIYLADSAGNMLGDDVRARVGAVRNRVGCEIGLHMHNNLGVAVSNSLAGVEEGVTWIDGSLGGLGAGAGNTPGEVLAVVLQRLGLQAGIDVDVLMDSAEQVVRPAMKHPQIIDRESLVIGDAGVYSSFLGKAQKLGKEYGVSPRELLIQAGRLNAVAGQEDLLEDLAIGLFRLREQPAGS